MNWYEDPDFLGFVVSYIYQPRHSMHFTCRLNIHGIGFEFNDKYRFSCYCGNLSDHQVWVWWYPYKMAIFKGHHHKFTHFTTSFLEYGVNLVFVGDVDSRHTPHAVGSSSSWQLW